MVAERILCNTGVPVPAQFLIVWVQGLNKTVFTRNPINIPQIAALRHGKYPAWIIALGQYIKAVAEVHFLPLAIAHPAFPPYRRRAYPGAVVLKATVDIKRRLIVEIQVVKLTNRNVFGVSPGIAPIKSDIEAPVIAIDDVFAVIGIDPEGVVVGVNAPVIDPVIEGAPPVDGAADLGINGIKQVLIRRIYINFGVVKRAISLVFIGHFAPFEAAIGTFVQGIVLGLHQGVHDIGVAFGNGQSQASQVTFGQTVFAGTAFPALAPIVGDIEARTFAAAFKKPGPTLVFPHRRNDFIGIGWVRYEVGAAS